jgi:hypothetical protein
VGGTRRGLTLAREEIHSGSMMVDVIMYGLSDLTDWITLEKQTNSGRYLLGSFTASGVHRVDDGCR